MLNSNKKFRLCSGYTVQTKSNYTIIEEYNAGAKERLNLNQYYDLVFWKHFNQMVG